MGDLAFGLVDGRKNAICIHSGVCYLAFYGCMVIRKCEDDSEQACVVCWLFGAIYVV